MSGQSRHVVLREKQATLEHHRHLDQSEACLNHEAVLLCRPRSSFSRAQDESHASGGHIGPLTPRCGYSRARGSPAGVRGWGTEGAEHLERLGGVTQASGRRALLERAWQPCDPRPPPRKKSCSFSVHLLSTCCIHDSVISAS